MHVLLNQSHPCQTPAEPCGLVCRYRLNGTATCALVAAATPRGLAEIAKLMGAPLRLVEMAEVSGLERWRAGMKAAGVRAPAVKPRTEEDERREAYGQLRHMLASVLDVPAHGPGRRLTVDEIRKAYPGTPITRGRTT